jgi:hypothetical protein
MIMQLPPLSGMPSYTEEHANPRNFTVAKLLHALEYLRCCNLSTEEEAAHRHQHDCEMMRMAAPLFSLLRSNLSALRRTLSWLEMP